MKAESMERAMSPEDILGGLERVSEINSHQVGRASDFGLVVQCRLLINGNFEFKYWKSISKEEALEQIKETIND